MNKEEIILRGIDEVPMFTFNTKTKEFSVLGHKFEGVNSIEDFINYIHNLDKENKKLKDKVNQLETSIATKDSELLQLKEELRQLKTNRDEVIKLIKFEWEEILKNEKYSNHLWTVDGLIIKKIISSLERGKE